MKWYFYVIIASIILVIILFALLEVVKRKKIYQRFLDCQYRAGKKRYEIIEAKKKEYDFVLKADDVHLYIKYISVPSNSQICINAKETWQLNYGGNKSNAGRVYPNKMYLDELVHFLKNDIIGDDKALKVVLVYPSVEGIVRYLNESELDTIDIKKSPYGYKIMQYQTFKEELNYILRENEEKWKRY